MAEITVYSTSTCPYCHMLKEYLDSKKVEYKDVVLDKEPSETQAFIDTCGSMAVPCTHVKKDNGKEEVIVGFDKEKVDAALGTNV